MPEKEIKRELQKIYQPPAPEGKEAFLAEFRQSHFQMEAACGSAKRNDEDFANSRLMTLPAFMWGQIGYIKPWVWILSGVLLVWMLLAGQHMGQRSIVWVSAVTPLLAMSLLTESAKSQAYRMEELELATRFSLKGVLLARLGVLGVFHGAVFGVVIMILKGSHLLAPVNLACVLGPYLLTIYLGIHLIRRFRGRESLFICYGVPVLVSLVTNYIRVLPSAFFRGLEDGWWVLLFGGCVVLAVRELILFYRQTEELVWN